MRTIKTKLMWVFLLIIGISMASFAAADTYCTPHVDLGIFEGDYIARVQLGSLDNVTSGDAVAPDYYIYYSGGVAVPDLIASKGYTLTVGAGLFPSNNRYAAWIDFNHDGTFQSAEKLGETSALLAGQEETMSFTVPANAVGGTTRMRVREVYNTTSIDPCSSYATFGESEDYDVNILAGNGKKIVIPVDNCPDGDTSATPYDGLCSGISSGSPDATFSHPATSGSDEMKMSTGANIGLSIGDDETGPGMTGSMPDTGNVELTETDSPFTDSEECPDVEIEGAYMFAHGQGITTMQTCRKARTDDYLTRGEAAKMIALFATKVLHKVPNSRIRCTFPDTTTVTSEMQEYATTACKLGLMGRNGEGMRNSTMLFHPTNLLTKAEFVTMLSRLLYGDKNNNTDECWYCKHVDALKAMGTITVTTDLMDPLKRGRAMLMMMRLDQ